MTALSFVRFEIRQKPSTRRWFLVGVIIGLVSALALTNNLVLGIGYFSGLSGPLGFYPPWFLAIMPLVFYAVKRTSTNRRFVAIHNGLGVSLGVMSPLLYTLAIFGINIGQMVLRV